MTKTHEQIAAGLTMAINETTEQLMRWADGPENMGPYAHEAHRICVHITASLRLLESNFRAALTKDHPNG